MWWRRRPLLAGAATLFLAGVFTRLVGTLYRILLVRSAGEDILGLFQMVMPVYRVAFTLATLGLPIAIARLSADALGRKDETRAQRLCRVGVTLIGFSSAAIAIALWASSGLLAVDVLTDPRTRLPLSLLGLLLFPAALSAGYRSVLQGRERMGPVAVSTSVEALVRSPLVLYAVAVFMPLGTAWGAAGIVLGLTVGEIASLAVLIWAVRQANIKGSLALPAALSPKSERAKASARFVFIDHIPVGRRLLRVGLPVGGSGLINNLLNLFSVAVIPRSLALAGYTMEEAVRAYGRLSGMAMPLMYMPMVAVWPIIQVLVPAVSNRVAKGGVAAIRPMLRKAFWVAGAVGGAAALAFATLPDHLGVWLYGVADLEGLVRPLAVAAPVAYVGYVAQGILYGLGRTGLVMVNSVIGNCVRLALIWSLAPSRGIEGVLWAMMADYGVTAALNLVLLPSAIRRAAR